MARKFIGERYVPIYGGEWDRTKTYESLTNVIYNGATYTSKKSVPIGILINDTNYWYESGCSIELVNKKFNDERVFKTPEMFGAKADGITDDTNAFMNAISDCIKYGYKLLLSAKTYYIENPIYIDTCDLIIEGENVGKSIIKTGNKSAFVLGENALCERIIFRDFTIFGNGTGDSGIVIGTNNYCARIKIINVNIRNFNKTEASAVNIRECYYLHISRCWFKDNYYGIVAGRGSKTTTILVDEQTTLNDNVYGFFTNSTNTDSFTFNDCQIENNTGNAIYMNACAILYMNECYLENNSNGIYLEGIDGLKKINAIIRNINFHIADGYTINMKKTNLTIENAFMLEPSKLISDNTCKIFVKNVNGTTYSDFLNYFESDSSFYINEYDPVDGTFTSKTNDFHAFNGGIISKGTKPNGNVLSNGGTNASISFSAESTDTKGIVSLSLGSGASAGDLVKVNFSRPFKKTPTIIMTPRNQWAATLVNNHGLYVSASDGSGFKISVINEPNSVIGYGLEFNYIVIG